MQKMLWAEKQFRSPRVLKSQFWNTVWPCKKRFRHTCRRCTALALAPSLKLLFPTTSRLCSKVLVHAIKVKTGFLATFSPPSTTLHAFQLVHALHHPRFCVRFPPEIKVKTGFLATFSPSNTTLHAFQPLFRPQTPHYTLFSPEKSQKTSKTAPFTIFQLSPYDVTHVITS